MKFGIIPETKEPEKTWNAFRFASALPGKWHPEAYPKTIMILWKRIGFLAGYLFSVMVAKEVYDNSLSFTGIKDLCFLYRFLNKGIKASGVPLLFSLLTFIVAIPSAVKVFNWIATMYKGAILIRTPFLYIAAFLFLFMIGGLSGLMLGS